MLQLRLPSLLLLLLVVIMMVMILMVIVMLMAIAFYYLSEILNISDRFQRNVVSAKII